MSTELETRLTSAGVASAGGERIGVILGLPPVWRGEPLVGPAFTAAGVAGDNLVLHRALAEAPRGCVLVAALEGDAAVGHWGELMCVAAAQAGVLGLVVSGAVRDIAQIEVRRFPVFHAGVGPRAAAKAHPGEVGGAVRIRGVEISPGDLIVADADGIAVVPQGLVTDVTAQVAALDQREAEVVQALQSGATTLEALGLGESGVTVE